MFGLYWVLIAHVSSYGLGHQWVGFPFGFPSSQSIKKRMHKKKTHTHTRTLTQVVLALFCVFEQFPQAHQMDMNISRIETPCLGAPQFIPVANKGHCTSQSMEVLSLDPNKF